MSNTLTKDLGSTILSPAIQGSTGTPPTPAYCATTQETETVYPVNYVPDGIGGVTAIPGSSYTTTTTTTTCYPASPGTPSTAFQPANVTYQFNLGWSAGARSASTLEADGSAAFSVSQSTIGAVIGLDSGAVEFSYGGAKHALYFRSGLASVLESGVILTGAVPYTVSDVFSIERASSTVRYFKNGALIYTSTSPSYGTQYLEASLYSGGDAVLNASLELTTTIGFGTGSASLMAVSAYGGDTENSSGYVSMLPVAASGTGVAGTEQGGVVTLLAMQAAGSAGTYADGTTILLAIGATGAGTSIESAPSFSLGAAQIGYIGSAGHGLTSGNTTGEAAASKLRPMNASGSSYAYGGGEAEFLPVSSYGAQAIVLTGYAFIDAPSAYIQASGHDSTGENESNITLPAATVSGWFGGFAKVAASCTIGFDATVHGMGVFNQSSPSATIVASGLVSGMASAELTFGSLNDAGYLLSGYGGATAELLSPSAGLDGSARTGNVAGAMLKTAKAELAGYGGATAELNTASVMLSASAASGTVGNAMLRSRPAEIEAYSGGVADLKSAPVEMVMIAYSGAVAGAALRSRPAEIEAFAGGVADLKSAKVTLDASAIAGGVSSASLKGSTARLIGYGGAVCSIRIGAPTVTADSTTGATGRARLVLPLYELEASATMHAWGKAELLMPAAAMATSAHAWLMAPHATLKAIGTATVTASYEAYAVNLAHDIEAVDQTTRYTHYPFTHIVRHQNSYFGVSESGLYLLEGPDDDGTAIPWSIRTGATDFGKATHKTIASAYFGGRLGPGATVTLYAGEKAGLAYPYVTPRGQLAQNYRQRFGKGAKSRYCAIGANGLDTMELDELELETFNMTRRI